MMFPNMGIAELLVVLVSTFFALALPVGVLYLLFVIYKKLNNIEELLKKNKE